MRNRYPGTCFVCGERVEAGEGLAIEQAVGWVVRHVGCHSTSPHRSGKRPALGGGYAQSPEHDKNIVGRDARLILTDEISEREGL